MTLKSNKRLGHRAPRSAHPQHPPSPCNTKAPTKHHLPRVQTSAPAACSSTPAGIAEGAVLDLSFAWRFPDWKCKRAAKSVIPSPVSESACNLLTSARTPFIPSSGKRASRAACSARRAKPALANQLAASPLVASRSAPSCCIANARSPKQRREKPDNGNPPWIYLLPCTPLFCNKRIMRF